MSEPAPVPGKFVPPMSSYRGPADELIGRRALSPPSRPGTLASLDGIEIVSLLGSGGMGVVFLGRTAEPAGEVAVKLIKPELTSDEQILRRFLKEAGHMEKLRHPHIVPVLQVKESAQGAYFVMPYFDGGNLSKWIQPGGKLSAETVLVFALQVAEGLQFAHRRGIIHRDLKPTNILVTPKGRVVILDFGLSAEFGRAGLPEAHDGRVVGTAPFMAPEQAAGRPVAPASDWYSVGVVLFEALTGKLPFHGRTREMLWDKQRFDPPPPNLVVPGLPEDLNALCVELLRRDPECRPTGRE
ncbi:MAG TPA: serine/threonine-protein kinase, partial [Opitutaceae bacterium]|nr:serine/threonine-protein kinase [Opitutaceae bacterium]